MPTGPGSFDAQGVWQYGESDENPLASDVLNRGMKSVSDQFALVRADLLDLQDPPDTDQRLVLPSATTPLPDGEAKFEVPWVSEASTRFLGLAFRVRGGHVYITGAAKSTAVKPANNVIFRLPPNARPSRAIPFWAIYNGVSSYVHIQTSGDVILDAAATVNGTVIFSAQFPAALA